VNIFALEVWDDEASKCSFYTVRWADAERNETDKFFDKYDNIPALKTATQQLLSFVLDSIGEIVFLYPNFPLRLYALRINYRGDIVVLFNGGLKSAQTNQASKELNLKWIEACRFAKRIEEALRDGEIMVDTSKRRLLSADGDEDIYL